MIRVFARLLVMIALLASAAGAVELHVDNSTGDVNIRVVYSGELRVQTSSPERIVNRDDVEFERTAEKLAIRVEPADGARIDLDLDVPFGTAIEVNVGQGAFRFHGFPSLLIVATLDGLVEIEAPWDATRLLFFSLKKPGKLDTPQGFGFRQSKGSSFPGANWVLEDKLNDARVTYGRIRVRSESPSRVTLKHLPIPPESPTKMHWQAKEVARRMLQAKPSSRPRSRKPPLAPPPIANALDGSGGLTFTSDVRLVNLSASVYDKAGHPLTGLPADAFEVLENGVPQRVATAGSEDAPFNLAILFDFSGSTMGARERMKRIARLFTRVARPQDRLAFYILARNQFHVISPLTTDHDSVRRLIDEVPPLSGGSPIYDSIVLAYDQELAKLEGERNALLVISDGKDNRMKFVGAPSKVSYRQLVDVAKRMNALVYPIFLGPDPSKLRKRSLTYEAYARFVDFAKAAGGRSFAAATIEDFQGVTKEVAEELRSVYTVAYYPSDQNFNGAWRKVQIRVDREGAQVRHREGYFAQ